MKPILLVGLGLMMSGLAARAAESTVAKALPSFEEIIFNKADFIARLPENTLICASITDKPDDPAVMKELQAALKQLGPTPGVEFVRRPAAVRAPRLLSTVTPKYPYELRRAGITGEAKFLVLVNSKGGVGAVYCFKADQLEFAVAAAHSLVQWTYEPAMYGKTKVPILLLVPIGFSLSI